MSDSFEALVVASFGRHLQVRDDRGQRHNARPFGRKLSLVCGDRVRCERNAQNQELHVVATLPRRNALQRSNARGGAEAVVANISLLVIVLAPRPAPDPFMVDRYLAAAASANIQALLLVNKIDLGVEPELDRELANWERLGYGVQRCAAREARGIAEFAERLRGHTAVVVGQSGVGKSSLLGQLVPLATIETGELVREEEGRHTTTASQLYELPGGGELIDSPGVRDFAPAISALEPRSLGFIEVDRAGVSCKFQDCRHMQEPHCGVRAALEAGGIDPRRYESYRRLRRLFEDLTAAQRPG
jgi:ribosome biogenesis GTPase